MNKYHWLIATGSIGLLLWSCSSDDTTTNGPTGSAQGGGLSNGGAGGEATSSGSGGSIGIGGGSSCENSCSADLQTIIDCNGAVVSTCPGAQACLNGECDDMKSPCEVADASKSSYGCDFYAVKPDLISVAKGACFAAYVANTWSTPVKITVSRNGTAIANNGFIQIPQGQGSGLSYVPYDDTQGLPAGEIAILFLAHETTGGTLPTCPVPAAENIEVGVLGTGRGAAFNITTDRPVVAYSIMPYGGGPSAVTSSTLLLPTSAWDTNYIAINAYAKSQAVVAAQPSLNIVASEANTTVTVLPKVGIVGGQNVDSAVANTPVEYTLQAGEYVQLSQNEELTGSVIQADKPIGLWGAASCMSVPVNVNFCDSAHQQIPPVKALGSRYAAVRHRNRSSANGEETPPWRLVGAVDDTQLTWTPSTPAGAPTTLDQGELAEFDAAGPFVVASQDAEHPFYVGQYMTGAQQNNGGNEGDPEWVNVIPVDQYLDSYVFLTDPTYSETSLVVVRRRSKATGNFEDVILDCAGPLSGWQPLGDYEYTRIDLVTGNFEDVGNCSNGRHKMSSSAAFGVTVWGWGTAAGSTINVSYAYPAGASVQPINEVVVLPIPN